MQLQNFNREGVRTRPVSCDFTYLVDATISLYNSWPTMFRQNHKPRAQKRYRTVGIGSSAAYCDGKNVELVIAALNRGGFVRPECAYSHKSAANQVEQRQKTNHDMLQHRASSYPVVPDISFEHMNACNPDTPAARGMLDLTWQQPNYSYRFGPI